MPLFMVLMLTSRWVSSAMIAPSVPTISIHVDEKFGYAGGSTQPAPIVKTQPSSKVTMIHTIRHIMRRLHNFANFLCIDADRAVSARNTRGENRCHASPPSRRAKA